MKIFRNRTVIGVLCILLALIICFGVTPLFSRSASEKTEIVRVTKDIKEGDEITAEMVQTVEVGAYNLPQNLMTDKKEVVGKYATADLAAGDYILSSKLSAVPAAENAYLYMEQTVLREGKPYYAVGGQLCRYPRFVPENYVLLKLTPCQQDDNWYRWNQEVPLGSSKELIEMAKEFSALKIGYRGDLWFSAVETIDVPAFLRGEIISQKELTAGEAWSLLFDKTENEMASYMKQLDLLSHDELILAADEISAMMTCHSELMSQGESLPRRELIFLLNEDKPLKLLRNAWLDYQNVDVGEEFQNVLTGLYDQKQEQKQEPQMTM